MLKIGVTGGIGSGKSLLCKHWQQLGACLVLADPFAKDLMVNDLELVQKIKQKFGEQAYLKDGSLNKEFIRSELFEKGRTPEMNALVHPLVRQRLIEKMQEEEKKGTSVFVYEAALLLNEGRPTYLNCIVWVDADVHTRLLRASERDGIPLESLKKRLHYQSDLEEKKTMVDYVILNNGTKEDFLKRSENLFHTIIKET